jgi:hypothetical protein
MNATDIAAAITELFEVARTNLMTSSGCGTPMQWSRRIINDHCVYVYIVDCTQEFVEVDKSIERLTVEQAVVKIAQPR